MAYPGGSKQYPDNYHLYSQQFNGYQNAPPPQYQDQTNYYATYATPSTAYAASSASYAAPSTSYAAPSTAYAVSSTSYAAPSTSYAASSTSYAAPLQHSRTSNSIQVVASYNNTGPSWYPNNGQSKPLSGSYHRPVGPEPPSMSVKETMKAASDLLKAGQQYFPVSCGTEHKSNEPGYVPKRVPIRPDIMTKMTLANAKLEIDPNNKRALKALQDAMAEHEATKSISQPPVAFVQPNTNTIYHNTEDTPGTFQYNPWQAGAFTGKPLIEPMERWDLDSQDPRTWAKKDFFCNLKPLREGFGRDMMKRMGWREGKPLGKNKTGCTVPLEVQIKTDRKGLMNEVEEVVRKKPDGGTVKETGPNWMVKIVNNKHTVSGLGELHQAMGHRMPCYTALVNVKAGFNFSVETMWGTFSPSLKSNSKKDAKSKCAYHAIKEILKLESKRFGMLPPYESPDSSHLSAAFVPTSKSCKGQALLYTNFYKGGELLLHNSELIESTEPSSLVSNNSNHSNQRSQRLTKNQKYDIKMNVSSIEDNGLKGAAWIMKLVNGKNCMAAVTEVCQAIGKPPPDYTDIDINMQGEMRITLKTPWGDMTPEDGSMVQKDARWAASYHAIRRIIYLEAMKAGQGPPIEDGESEMFCLSFKTPPTIGVEQPNKPPAPSNQSFSPPKSSPKSSNQSFSPPSSSFSSLINNFSVPPAKSSPVALPKPSVKPPSVTTAKPSAKSIPSSTKPYYYGRRR